jgi:ABC-2 type transport system permease protein
VAAHRRNEGYALYALWLREFKVFQREKSRVIGSIASPLVFLFTLGFGFGATTTFMDPRYAAFPYPQFMFPGVIGMSVLFGTIFYGMGIIWDRRLDVLKEVLVAPVSRTTIFFGKVLGGCTEAVAQGILLIVLSMLIFHTGLAGALVALPFVLLLAILFVSIGLFIGSFFTSYEGFNLVMSFLTFPAVFLSGAFYPVEQLPKALAVLVRFNPATYAVDGLRGALLGPHAFSYALDVAVLAVWCVVFLYAGTWAFKRMT